jgi:hypothetical protein
MRTFVLIGLVLIVALGATAQSVNFPALDSSPADIAYFPVNVAKSKGNSSPLIRVLYSRPSKKGREIFGVHEQFGKVWRAGANESTEITFYKPVVINKKRLKAGTYSLFVIPTKTNWTFIINGQTDRWGAFTYDQTKDVVRTEVPISTLPKPLETLSITFKAIDKGAALLIAWDFTLAELPITIK